MVLSCLKLESLRVVGIDAVRIAGILVVSGNARAGSGPVSAAASKPVQGCSGWRRDSVDRGAATTRLVLEDPVVAGVSDPRRSLLIHSRRARKEPPNVELDLVVGIVTPAVDGVLGEVRGLPARGSRAIVAGIDGMSPVCVVGVVPSRVGRGEVRAAGGGRGFDRRRQNGDDQEGGLCARARAGKQMGNPTRIGEGEPGSGSASQRGRFSVSSGRPKPTP